MNLTLSSNVTVDPLFYNITCEGPHLEEDKVYTYILNDAFIGLSIFVAVVNFLAALPTSLLNFVVILGFVRQNGLRTVSNRLLFSICAADVVTGAFVEPVFGAQVLYVTKRKHDCGLSNYLTFLVPVLIVITMVTHMTIALERYSSIHFIKMYKKIFTKRYVTWFILLIWAICLFCFILPFATGDPLLGTRIIGTLILVSLAVCSFCYISMYQDFKWQNGKPTAKIKGPYIIRGTKPTNRSVTENEEFQKNIQITSFYFKLFICMVVFYLLNLTKSVLNAYGVFSGNVLHIMHFVFDTFLFINALVNPCLMLLYCGEISKAVSLTYKAYMS